MKTINFKQLLSISLAVMMIFFVLPDMSYVYAEEISINSDTTLTSGDVDSNDTIVVRADVTLTLSGISIDRSGAAGEVPIIVDSNCTIEIDGANTLISKAGTPAIKITGGHTLTIIDSTDDGSINITGSIVGENGGDDQEGASIVVKSGDIDITGDVVSGSGGKGYEGGRYHDGRSGEDGNHGASPTDGGDGEYGHSGGNGSLGRDGGSIVFEGGDVDITGNIHSGNGGTGGTGGNGAYGGHGGRGGNSDSSSLAGQGGEGGHGGDGGSGNTGGKGGLIHFIGGNITVNGNILSGTGGQGGKGGHGGQGGFGGDGGDAETYDASGESGDAGDGGPGGCGGDGGDGGNGGQGGSIIVAGGNITVNGNITSGIGGSGNDGGFPESGGGPGEGGDAEGSGSNGSDGWAGSNGIAGSAGSDGAGGDISISSGNIVCQNISTAENGKFSTTDSGSAIIRADSIKEGDNPASDDSWKGIIIVGHIGKVYGSQALLNNELESDESLMIAEGTTLTIDSGITFTNNGQITNDGTIVNNGIIDGTGTFGTNGVYYTLDQLKPLSSVEVDYLSEELMNFDNTLTYSIDDGSEAVTLINPVTTSATDYIGKTITVTTMGDYKTSKNSTQNLIVDSRPEAPVDGINHTDTTPGESDGSIINNTADVLQYTLSGSDNWVDIAVGDAASNLSSGRYIVRKKAVATAFSSKESEVILNGVYNVTVLNGSSNPENTAYSGDVVSIGADYLGARKKFKNWTSDSPGVTFENADNGRTTFVMPINDVTISANYEDVPIVPTPKPKKPKPEEKEQEIVVDNDNTGRVKFSSENPKTGEDVVMKLNPDEGYGVRNVRVLDNDGNEVEIIENEDGTYSFVMPEGGVNVDINFTFLLPEKPRFEDVDLKDPHALAIEHLSFLGLIKGVSEENFAPDVKLNRAMVVTILYRLAEEPGIVFDNIFEDVLSGLWYSDSVSWAISKGIAKGYNDTEFAPLDIINMEQLLTFIYRYETKNEVPDMKEMNLSNVKDGTEVSDYAKSAIMWALSEGILLLEDGMIYPQKELTRGEMAEIIHRYLEK